MAPELRCCLGHDDPPRLVWRVPGSPDVVRCPRCGLVFLRTLPYPDPIQPYGAEYFVGYASHRRDFQREADRLLDRIGRLRHPPGDLVDIGAGLGYHVLAARARGWSAEGYEPSAWAADYARRTLGVTLHRIGGTGLRLNPNSIDVALVNHTLEHVPEPAELLRELRTALRPAGLVILGVPNWNGVLRRVLGRRWPHLDPSRHLWHFTRRTLRALLERSGFSVERLVSELGFPRPAIGFHPTPKMLWNEFLKTIYFFHHFGHGEALFAVARRG